jgi:tetratricopeptide (TPR) repeat protein
MKVRSMTLPALAALLVFAPAVGLAQVQRGERTGSGTPGEVAPDSKSVTDPKGPTWEALVEAGNRAYRDGQYDQAETAFRRAIEVAQRTTPRDWRIVISLTNLGDVVRTRGRSTEAAALYRQALVSAEGLRSADHPDLLDPLKTLAWFYHEQRRYSEAEAIFTRILRIEARGSSARDRVRQAAYVNILAELAEFQGRYGAAGRLHLETIRVLGGPDPLDRAALGTTLTQLSLLLRVQGKETEAVDIGSKAFQVLVMAGPEGEATIRLAIKSREETVGPEHPGVARMLQPLAFLLEAQGRYADAAVVWRRAIEILERSRPPASLDVAASLEAYAAFLAKLGFGSEARSAEARAAAIRGR